MKTLILTLSVSLLSSSVAVFAKDLQAEVVREKPMLLCYAVPTRHADYIEALMTNRQQEEDAVEIQSHSAPEKAISISSISTISDQAPQEEISGFAARGIRLQAPSADALSKRDRAKFCMGNLLEGSLYDFKRKNNLHVEIAAPNNQYKDNSSMLRYDQFAIAFLLKFKL